MRTYGMYNYASLFGMNNTGNTNSMSSLYGALSDYSSLKSGAYGKLTKAYYAKNTDTSKKTTSSNKNSDALEKLYGSRNEDSLKAMKTVSTEAGELTTSAGKLIATGKDGVFASEKDYNKDKAYEAVSKFVADYNDTVDKLSNASDSTVRNSGNSMKRMTDIMKNSLSKAGISIEDDGKLKLDEDTFKNADYDKLKSVFSGKNSYAGIISNSASRIVSNANSAVNRYGGGIYGSNGTYGGYGSYNNFYSGMYYNSFF